MPPVAERGGAVTRIISCVSLWFSLSDSLLFRFPPEALSTSWSSFC